MSPSTRMPLTFVPNFLDDQTLYSWVSQFHAHSGNAYPHVSLEQLFWTNKAGWNFNIPSHLDNFCAATRRIFGEPEDIIEQRSILPAYLWFRPVSAQRETVLRLRNGITAGIPQRLRMWRTYTGLMPPRQLCLQCAKEDVVNFGEAYWRRSLQIPGVKVCLRHHSPLLVTKPETRHKRRSEFITPSGDMEEGRFSFNHVPTDRQLEERLCIAEIAIQLTEQHKNYASRLQEIHALLHERIAEMCGTTACLRGDKAEYVQVAKGYREAMSGADEAFGQAAMATIMANKLLGHLLLKMPPPTSGLDYVMLIWWLFGSWTQFRTSLDARLPSIR